MKKTEFAQLIPEAFGSDSLVWSESPLSAWLPEFRGLEELDELCDIYYAPLNFRDALNAYGKLPLHSRPKGNETRRQVIIR